MRENYCCGGGHCGILPGYDFICPQCGFDTYAPTGEPLKEGEKFICNHCASHFQVKNFQKDIFEVEVLTYAS